MNKEEIRIELNDYNCNQNDMIIIVEKKRFDILNDAYTHQETENLLYIDGIDNAIYCIEKENYNK